MKKKIFFSIFLIMMSMMAGCLEEDGDGDGLPDSLEKDGWPILVTYQDQERKWIHVTSDSHKKDTDGDGLNDYDEYMTSIGGYSTNPRKEDTDGDGLTDYDEINGTYGYLTDPTRWDTDRDGLGDGDEMNYSCDPFDRDTDEDYFLDGREAAFWKELEFDEHNISDFLNNQDADGDGLLDGEDADPLQKNMRICLQLNSINISRTGWIDLYIWVDNPENMRSENIKVTNNVEKNLSSNKYKFDLDDKRGSPGNPGHWIVITAKYYNNYLRIDGDGSYTNNNFSIPDGCKEYCTSGKDGILSFTITDASTRPYGFVHFPPKYGNLSI